MTSSKTIHNVRANNTYPLEKGHLTLFYVLDRGFPRDIRPRRDRSPDRGDQYVADDVESSASGELTRA